MSQLYFERLKSDLLFKENKFVASLETITASEIKREWNVVFFCR